MMKHVFAGFVLAGAVLTAGMSQLVNTNAEIDYEKWYIPQYQNFNFIDVAISGTGNEVTYISLTDNGRVFTQGMGWYGTIGHGFNASSNVPVEITANFALTGEDKIVKVFGGQGSHAAAISQTGRFFVWGLNSLGQLGVIPNTPSAVNLPYDITGQFSLGAGEKIVDASLGKDVTLVRTSANYFYTMGSHTNGRLGRIANPGNGATANPGRLLGVNFMGTFDFKLSADEELIDFGIIAQTGYITTNKRLYSWGAGANHVHGNGSTSNLDYATLNSTINNRLAGRTIVSASLGENHGLMVLSDNTIHVWGNNAQQQLTSKFTPTQLISNPNDITSYFYDEIDHFNSSNPYSIVGSDGVIQSVKAFSQISTMRVSYGDEYEETYAWGRNGTSFDVNNIAFYYGLLGTGYYMDTVNYYGVPQTIANYDYVDNNFDFRIKYVNGGFNSAILTSEGGIAFFGNNSSGQLGNGLEGIATSSEISGSFSDYYYVMSFEYRARNLKVNWANYISYPFTKESIQQYDDEGKSWIISELLIYYYGLAERDFGYNPFNNLDDVSRSLFGRELIDDLSAAYFEYDFYKYFIPEGLNVDELEEQGEQGRFWTRDWAEYLVAYNLDFGFDDPGILSEASIAQLEPETEAKLEEIRALLNEVKAFEAKLVAFRETVSIYDDTVFNIDTFKNYEQDILDIFAAYEALNDLPRLYFQVYNEYDDNFDYLYGYYQDLEMMYLFLYIDSYETDILDMYDIEDEFGIYGLFENIDEIKALLLRIDDLPQLAYDEFTEYDEFNDVYDYDGYWYWNYLNDLLPLLEEAEPVYQDLMDLEDEVEFEDGYPMYTKATALQAIALYAEYLLLSEDAQNTLDPDYIFFLYEEALYYLASEVEDALNEIWLIEDDLGTLGLFENLEEIEAALALYDDLLEEASDYLSDDTIEYYMYLKSLQAALIEAQPVYVLINELPEDTEELTASEIEDILEAVAAYNELSEDAQDLLDGQFLFELIEASTIQSIDSLPELEDITLDDEEAVRNARAAYDLLTEDQKESLDESYLERLLAAEARILELQQGNLSDLLITFSILILHIGAAAFFVFKRRKEIATLTGWTFLSK